VQTPPPAPKVTAAPAFKPREIEERDALVTLSVSSCYNYVGPATDGKNGCECPGFEGVLPLTTVTDGGSTSIGCSAYSTVVTISTTANPYPYTSTYTNSAIVAVSEQDKGNHPR
jgi:hypothetical protein